jgi:hypothetical protein
MPLNRTKSLSEAISRNYVVGYSQDMLIYNQYWDYCKKNKLPFIAISPNKYCKIIIDNLPVGTKLSEVSMKMIAELSISIKRKGKDSSIIGPIRSHISRVKPEDAEKLAEAAYNIAISDKNSNRLLNPTDKGG